ncbi:MAG: efflux RND transporter periplasmic adaptor subunit [Syntrophaceae bacterium]|nr:efflux RND transporter periplasmic adaptor subunit [Syntrophaceae bacterium]
MKSNSKTGIIIISAFIVFCFMLTGCGEKKMGGPMPMPEVAVITIQTKPVITTTELPGRTSANLVAEVRPQVSGIIQKRLFTEGSDVKEGQPLFQIDPALYQVALDNAKAALARSEAQLSTIQLRETRLKDLLVEKAVSQQDYDDASAALKQVQADIQYGKASVETARINLQYTTITAPISGRIGRSNVTGGALVTAHQPVALATIQKIDPMYVDVTQSTADILKLRRQLQEGQLSRNGESQRQVRLLLDDNSEYPLQGKLQFQDVSVDPTSGSVVLRMAFPNPKGVLMPGMFVRTIVQEGIHKNAILVPQQAVSRDPKGNPQILIVDKDGKVQQKQLTLDRAIGNEWLISSGIEQGDQVIIEGISKVKPGIPVKVVPFENRGKNSGANTNAVPPAQTK